MTIYIFDPMRPAVKSLDQGIQKATGAAGGIRALARSLGIRHSTILAWRHIPAERLLEIEKATGVPREQLRPDLYRKS